MEKKDSLFNKLLAQLEVSMQKNVNLSILVPSYKAQVQVDQGHPHKTRHIATNRKETGEEP